MPVCSISSTQDGKFTVSGVAAPSVRRLNLGAAPDGCACQVVAARDWLPHCQPLLLQLAFSHAGRTFRLEQLPSEEVAHLVADALASGVGAG